MFRRCRRAGRSLLSKSLEDGVLAVVDDREHDREFCLRLRDAYEATMPELYFGTEPLPTWDEVCSRVAEKRELL